MPRKIPENEDDFIQMQQEAIRRVREMQARANRTLEDAGMHITDHPDEGTQVHEAVLDQQAAQPVHAGPPPLPAPRPAGQADRRPPPEGRENAIRLPIFNISLDSDELLLLVMVFLLVREKADPWLVLALGYILIT